MTKTRVLITGAAGGIGEAIARRFVADGANVVLTDLRADRLEAVGASLHHPSQVRTLEMDVTNRVGLPQALAVAWEMWDGLDILVNNAGLYPSAPILEMTDEAWDLVLDVNLNGIFSLSREFARNLVENNRPGRIVNIGSGSAYKARRGAAHYSVAKAGLEMLTKSFAVEFAEHHINVNTICPGFIQVNSEINPLDPEYVRVIASGQPWPRPGTPDDIARGVAFLCGPDAEWITGATLAVDGGMGAGDASLPLSHVLS